MMVTNGCTGLNIITTTFLIVGRGETPSLGWIKLNSSLCGSVSLSVFVLGPNAQIFRPSVGPVVLVVESL